MQKGRDYVVWVDHKEIRWCGVDWIHGKDTSDTIILQPLDEVS
jgi:hypothetical protein